MDSPIETGGDVMHTLSLMLKSVGMMAVLTAAFCSNDVEGLQNGPPPATKMTATDPRATDSPVFPDAFLLEHPNALDPLIEAAWPQVGPQVERLDVRGQTLGKRVTWARDQDGAPGKRLFMKTPHHRSSIDLTIYDVPPEGAVPEWKAIERSQVVKRSLKFLHPDARSYSPLKLFEHILERRSSMAPDQPPEERAAMAALCSFFGTTTGASVRFSSETYSAFVDYTVYDRTRREDRTLETASVLIYERESGAFCRLVYVQFWPNEGERESIDTIVHVLLAGFAP